MIPPQPERPSKEISGNPPPSSLLNNLQMPGRHSTDPARAALERQSIEFTVQAARLIATGELAKAEDALVNQHTFLSSTLPANDHLVLTCQVQLGRLLLQRGKTELALNYLNSVADALQGQSMPTDEGLQRLGTAGLRELANAQIQAKDPRLLGTLDRLIALSEKVGGRLTMVTAELAFEKAMALGVLKAEHGTLKEAICVARSMVRQQKEMSPHRRGVILESLGQMLFNQGEWDEAHCTLQMSIQFLTEPERQAGALLMLSQIAAYQGDLQSGKTWLSVLKELKGWHTTSRLMIVEQVQRSLGIHDEPVIETTHGDLPDGTLASDPPHLERIKATLIQGHALFNRGELVVAQSVLEGAGVLISSSYHPNHFLWNKVHLLLSFTKIERAKLCEDPAEEMQFLEEAKDHALAAFSILRDQNSSYEDQEIALTVALRAAEALNDQEACAELERRLTTGLL